MSSIHETRLKNPAVNLEHLAKRGKPYTKPRLQQLGDLRSLTLGPSTKSFSDSGGGTYSETFPVIPTDIPDTPTPFPTLHP